MVLTTNGADGTRIAVTTRRVETYFELLGAGLRVAAATPVESAPTGRFGSDNAGRCEYGGINRTARSAGLIAAPFVSVMVTMVAERPLGGDDDVVAGSRRQGRRQLCL